MTVPAVTPARLAVGLLTSALCLALAVWLLSDEPLRTAAIAVVAGAVGGVVIAYGVWRAAARRGHEERKSSPLTTVLGLAAGAGGYYLAREGGAAGGALLVAGAAYLATFVVLAWSSSPP